MRCSHPWPHMLPNILGRQNVSAGHQQPLWNNNRCASLDLSTVQASAHLARQTLDTGPPHPLPPKARGCQSWSSKLGRPAQAFMPTALPKPSVFEHPLERFQSPSLLLGPAALQDRGLIEETPCTHTTSMMQASDFRTRGWLPQTVLGYLHEVEPSS